jgi:transcriptional regulator with XRE-family HTH domain
MPSARAVLHFGYVAANIRRARVRAGMTQERLAELAQLDLRFLQRIEAAKTNFSVSVLVALADALGVAPGSLFKKAALSPARRGRPPARRSRAK